MRMSEVSVESSVLMLFGKDTVVHGLNLGIFFLKLFVLAFDLSHFFSKCVKGLLIETLVKFSVFLL